MAEYQALEREWDAEKITAGRTPPGSKIIALY
jgi:hypothetical protein